jgi:WD and tetratricopeptide repeat-containing protein 1
MFHVLPELLRSSMHSQILLWSFPDYQHPPLVVSTQHRANIFGVQFLPCSNDTKLVSAAMDHTVQLHELDREEVKAWRRSSVGSGGVRTATQTASKSYYCHTNRVKVCQSAGLYSSIFKLKVLL